MADVKHFRTPGTLLPVVAPAVALHYSYLPALFVAAQGPCPCNAPPSLGVNATFAQTDQGSGPARF